MQPGMFMKAIGHTEVQVLGCDVIQLQTFLQSLVGLWISGQWLKHGLKIKELEVVSSLDANPSGIRMMFRLLGS